MGNTVRERTVSVATLLRSSRYVAAVGVLSLLFASCAAFIWSLGKAISAIALIVASYDQDAYVAIALMQVVDSVLLAGVLFISAVSLYALFIGELDLPSGIVAHDLYELKGKLSSVMVLVMALKFLEHLMEWKAPGDTLLFALAIAVVSGALIALAYLGGKET